MLSTHSLRTLKATVSQLPLCTKLEAIVPNYILCSNTIKLRKIVWADCLNATNSKTLSMAQANALNEYYSANGSFPEKAINIPQIIDPELTQVFVPTDTDLKTGKRNSISLTPIPSSGLYYEIFNREDEHPFAKLGMHQVEVNPASWSLHGDLVTEQKGFLKCFQLDDLPQIDTRNITMTDKKYLVMDFEISDFNVAVGMVGVGLPSLTTIGTFITNYVQREPHQIHFNIGFALGLHSTKKKSSNHFKPNSETLYESTNFQFPKRLSNMNHTRRIGFKATLVLSVEHEENLDRLYEILAQDFKIAGCPIFNKYINISNKIPEAYWMDSLNGEIQKILEERPHYDVLDAILDVYSDEDRITLPVASGFALLEPAKLKTNAEIMNHAHAFAESTFSCVELKYGPFKPSYIFERKILNQSFLHWDTK